MILRFRGLSQSVGRPRVGSRLVTRSTFGSSPFTDVLAAAIRAAFDSTERCVVLAAVAADAILWRDGACDLALLFLGATLLGLPEVSMENVGMALGPLVRGAKIGARTTRSPAHRGANPWAALTRSAPKSGWRVQRNFVSVFCPLEAMQKRCI